MTAAMSQCPILPPIRADAGFEYDKDSLGVSKASAMNLRDAIEPRNDVERAGQLDPEKVELPGPVLKKTIVSAAFWMVANTLATIGIVCFVISFLLLVPPRHTGS